MKGAVDSLIAALGPEYQEGTQPGGLNPSLLAYPSVSGSNDLDDRIQVFPADEGGTVQAGPVPISQYPTRINARATYNPFSNTLSLPAPVPQYEWWSSVPSFSVADLVEAKAALDGIHLQLPDDLPERIHQLAEEFKTSLSPFLNANQIMVFLAEEMSYFPNETGAEPVEPPEGHDPVDWFLFEQRAGGNGSFSSAFVVLARAAGIPARVVTGWTIEQSAGVQDVYASQSYQWAEIALEGVGWFTIDPATRVGLTGEPAEAELSALLGQLRTSTDPDTRVEAVQALDLIDNPEALPDLVEAMETDPNMDVRLAALMALQSLGFEELVQILLNHEDLKMRRAAAIALNALRDPRAVDPFVHVLTTDEDALVRVEVARGLAYIGKDQAEEQLLQAATSDEDASVREAAVRSLGMLNTAWTAQGLVPIVGSDPDSLVREASAWALGEIKEAVALRPLIRARSEDVEESVRQAAEDALGKWTSAQLLSILQESEGATERAAAAQLLGEGEYVEAIPALSNALHDSDEGVRLAALAALERIGDVRWLENGSWAFNP